MNANHITRILLTSALVLVFSAFAYKNFGVPKATPGTFRAEQMSKARVKSAYQEKWDIITEKLKNLNVTPENLQVFIRSFKKEQELECWVRNGAGGEWKKYASYPVCASSGELGPKRCQGDGQVPEGFYHVNVFNPYSNFHLSLGVSYPNAADRVFACKRDPGGAIMIHGSCVTIGCIPLTDDKIKELYVLCVEARNNGQKEIPIHIFPAKLSDAGLKSITSEFPEHTAFWKNLQTGYSYFENNKTLPKVTVDAKGNYLFQ
ncbi:MAG: hypothetical protein Fur0041_14650 [Bacteroidia bacterium]